MSFCIFLFPLCFFFLCFLKPNQSRQANNSHKHFFSSSCFSELLKRVCCATEETVKLSFYYDFLKVPQVTSDGAVLTPLEKQRLLSTTEVQENAFKHWKVNWLKWKTEWEKWKISLWVGKIHFLSGWEAKQHQACFVVIHLLWTFLYHSTSDILP